MPAWGFADVVESRRRRGRGRRALLRLLPDREPPARAARALLPRAAFTTAAPIALALTSAYNHYTRCASRPRVREGARELSDLAAAADPDFVLRRRLPARQRLFRRQAAADLQRLEQDRLRHGVLSRGLEAAAVKTHRAHVGRPRPQTAPSSRAWAATTASSPTTSWRPSIRARAPRTSTFRRHSAAREGSPALRRRAGLRLPRRLRAEHATRATCSSRASRAPSPSSTSRPCRSPSATRTGATTRSTVASARPSAPSTPACPIPESRGSARRAPGLDAAEDRSAIWSRQDRSAGGHVVVI